MRPRHWGTTVLWLALVSGCTTPADRVEPADSAGFDSTFRYEEARPRDNTPVDDHFCYLDMTLVDIAPEAMQRLLRSDQASWQPDAPASGEICVRVYDSPLGEWATYDILAAGCGEILGRPTLPAGAGAAVPFAIQREVTYIEDWAAVEGGSPTPRFGTVTDGVRGEVVVHRTAEDLLELEFQFHASRVERPIPRLHASLAETDGKIWIQIPETRSATMTQPRRVRLAWDQTIVILPHHRWAAADVSTGWTPAYESTASIGPVRALFVRPGKR